MSCDGDFGAGQNIVFYLVTTGLDINPLNGTVASTNYEYLKSIVTEKADLLYELPSLRQISNVNFSMYLDAYSTTPRTLYQALFGVARYSNPWSNELLTIAIEDATIYPKFKPNANQYSVNPYELYDSGYGLFKCVQISPGNIGWSPMGDFKVTETMPGPLDGYDKSVWGVLEQNQMNVYVKNAFTWTLLDEYVAGQNSTLVVAKTSPAMAVGKYWLRVSDATVYKYSNNEWESGETATVKNSLSGATIDGDKILLYRNSSFALYNYSSSKYTKKQLSQYIIRDKGLNSVFKNSSTENFIVEDGCIALLGGIVSHLYDGDASMVRVFQNGIYVGEYSGIDFKNVTVHESISLDNTVEVVHTNTQPGEGLSLHLVDLIVNETGQTEFAVPDDMIEFIELTVNGVSTYSVEFDADAHTITFDPDDAGFELDPFDSLVLSYLY